ncbi:hypothetical protein [Paractinoplanes toevensis]|uniref:Uncharacterized protein n=1 Tax=Paractinoplanes toevensis TaxID=571911 RepID=A0A919TGJ0_9ACTN|nr:hypothetical protein [Actinoplanes toevensis]GIM95619.1 hypothetical protein Ato02nite_074120 [Actinoplanes toevensis]
MKVEVDTAKVEQLAGDFTELSRSAAELARVFRADAECFASQDVFGSGALVGSYTSTYQQALGAVNQVTESFDAIGKKLSVVAANYAAASEASTPKSAS